MSVTIQTQANTNFVEVTLNKKITRQDYELFQPIIDAEIKKHGRICMLVVARNFDGWDLGASWEETRFIFSHYSRIDRIGLVGAAEWQKWLTFFCKPFTSAEVKFFNVDEEAEARKWVTAAEIINVDQNKTTPDETKTTTFDESGKKMESSSSCNSSSCDSSIHDSSIHDSCRDKKYDEEEIDEEEDFYSDFNSDEPLLEDDEESPRCHAKNREEELVGAK